MRIKRGIVDKISETGLEMKYQLQVYKVKDEEEESSVLRMLGSGIRY